jgi:hypothetical protein
MSSELQEATNPARTCRTCGASQPEGLRTCWLCRANLSGDSTTVAAAEHERTLSHGGHAGFSFSISTLLLITTLIAILSALVAEHPGLGIPVCVLMLPVLVRTAMVVRRRERAGLQVSAGEKAKLALVSFVVSFALSIVVLAVLGIAAIVTLFAVCVSGGKGNPFPVAIVIALVILIPTCAALAHWIRARYEQDTNQI